MNEYHSNIIIILFNNALKYINADNKNDPDHSYLNQTCLFQVRFDKTNNKSETF